MIKIFGKIRYHWQPDIALSIVYWCFTFSIGFVGIIFTLENTHIYWFTFFFIFIFLILCVLGMHRHFWIEEDKGQLHIVSLWWGHRINIAISSITKLLVSPHGVVIFSGKWENGRIYYMRRWHREPFIKDLINQPSFCGELENIEKITYEKQK